MYAELFPSAQRFISAVLAKVKFDVREIVVPTSVPIPCRCSPRWIAIVESPQCLGVFFISSRAWMKGGAQTSANLGVKEVEPSLARLGACSQNPYFKLLRENAASPPSITLVITSRSRGLSIAPQCASSTRADVPG